jgi:undecaprenyl-diphosphatase
MDVLYAVLLGIIQGITEWLPISSSAHLAIAQYFMGEVSVAFDITLHLATLFVVLFVFRKDVKNIIIECAKIPKEIKEGKTLKTALFDNQDRKIGWLVILGCIPTAIIGVVLDRFITAFFSSLLIIGIALIVTGIILWLTRMTKGSRNIDAMNSKDALLIGTFQGFSLIPGLSRSGFTISSGMFRGLDSSLAIRYSFLLSIPAIIGAILLHINDVSGLATINPGYVAIGMIVSFIVGYVFIVALIKIIKNRRFHHFAYYCWIAGVLLIVLKSANVI